MICMRASCYTLYSHPGLWGRNSVVPDPGEKVRPALALQGMTGAVTWPLQTAFCETAFAGDAHAYLLLHRIGLICKHCHGGCLDPQ